MVTSTGDVTHVDRIVDATDRIDELVSDLLQLARTGRQLDTEASVELDEIARSAWSHVWSPSAKLVVETEQTVVGDPSRIQQLFENLFRNSVEHGTDDNEMDSPDIERTTPSSDGNAWTDAVFDGVKGDPKGRGRTVDDGVVAERGLTMDGYDDPSAVDLTTAGRDDHSGNHQGRSLAAVRVLVGPLEDGFYIEDDGAGIPREDRHRVFEKGYTNASTGTGIGLSIVRQIVDAHGWSIRLTDGTAGGARFEITDVGFKHQPDPTGD